MTNTTNYELNLIEEHDPMDFAPLNENATIIDTQLKSLADDTAVIPTMQTAIGDNSTAITNLSSRMGTAETNISSNTTEINGIKTVNTSQQSAIDTNTINIGNLQTEAAALENKTGYIVQNLNGNITQPSIKGKVTYVANNVGINYDGNIYVNIPGSAIPSEIIEWSNLYVNASIHNRNGTGSTGFLPFVFCNAAFGSGGGLTLTFKRIDTIEETIPSPELYNCCAYAEIIFI